MCGIIACIADDRAAPILLEGLKRVEYRGYDSAGVATIGRDGILVKKDVGKIAEIEARQKLSLLDGRIGVAHTRWATHGGVTKRNAHPHTSCNELVAIAHNGIIKNYLKLKKELELKGHKFKSETDSEVIAHLLEEEYKRLRNPTRATASAARKLEGQYAFVALFQGRGDLLTGARNDAPLLVGLSERKRFLASDVLAFIEHTDRVIFMDNLEVVTVTDKDVRISDLSGKEVRKEVTQIAWELADVSKLDYAHYTLKEIEEQPSTLHRALIQEEEKLASFVEVLKSSDSVFLTGAGSSFHAALVLKHRLNIEARIRADAVVAGEFASQSHFMNRNSTVVAISQSGETADVLEAVKVARSKGARVLSIVNAVGSSLVSAGDHALHLNCGPEVGVAATKSFTAQLAIIGLVLDSLTGKETSLNGESLARRVKETLAVRERARALAKRYRHRPDFYFIGRSVHYPIALEGALKLKELSYIHAEGMPASELKHGTLALIEEGTPVVVLNPGDETYDDTLSNAHELKARGAEVIGITDRANKLYTHTISVPHVAESVMPILEVIPLQFLAYYTALERKNNPDYPRNLAKSVTVK
ncbi:MAG: glutamine--fructose-6-phosphate transaminase (isomerizing) [Thaumarchaeota archaeon]|nr:glutamine--fructose-6-phosphate transaminase (isomerizing) [Nitrososphaerota archaeon]